MATFLPCMMSNFSINIVIAGIPFDWCTIPSYFRSIKIVNYSLHGKQH